MEAHIKKLCNEHKELVGRLNELIKYMNEVGDSNPQESAFKYYQAKSMINYEDALRSRLNLAGITIANGNYYNSAIKLEDTTQEEVNDSQLNN